MFAIQEGAWRAFLGECPRILRQILPLGGVMEVIRILFQASRAVGATHRRRIRTTAIDSYRSAGSLLLARILR